MELNFDQPKHLVVIKSYQAGTLTLKDQTVTHSVVLTPAQVLPFPAEDFNSLTAQKLADLNINGVQVILIGTGATMKPIPLNWLSPWTQQRIGVEVMSTSAACRTFSLLAAENRSVMAILLIR